MLREGEEIAIWAYGHMVEPSLEAATRLAAEGVSITVVDARFAKPLDEELLKGHLRSHRHLVTVEAHQRAGGFGSAVLEFASRQPDPAARVRVLGIPDRFLEHRTTPDEQLTEVGLDADGIERTLRTLLGGARVR